MDETIDFYQANASEFFDSTIGVDMSHLYGIFESYLPNDAVILDVGCGAGRDLKHFRSQNFDVIGLDASSKLVALASDYSGCKVHCMTFNQIGWHNEFDGIWCCASLLHVPLVELPRIFTLLANALKTDGVMYVSFKYGRTERTHNGRRFSDLDESLLAECVAPSVTLTIEKTWVTNDARPGRESEKWLNAILAKGK